MGFEESGVNADGISFDGKLQEWLVQRNAQQGVSEGYKELNDMILETAVEVIPKKKVCMQSKWWWFPELGKLSTEVKQLKRRFIIY